MELKFNEAKTVRPNHLERCLCYDKFLKGYRCYVYDDISKYWCTQATTEHDPNGDNHIVDYADYQVTKWASLQQEQPEKYIELNGIKYKEVSAKTNDKICKDCDYFLDNGKCELVDCCPCIDDDTILERLPEQPEVDLEKFTEKIKTFQARYKYPESISVKGAMAFMARMFYQYPNVARQWYESLSKAIMEDERKEE